MFVQIPFICFSFFTHSQLCIGPLLKSKVEMGSSKAQGNRPMNCIIWFQMVLWNSVALICIGPLLRRVMVKWVLLKHEATGPQMVFNFTWCIEILLDPSNTCNTEGLILVCHSTCSQNSNGSNPFVHEFLLISLSLFKSFSSEQCFLTIRRKCQTCVVH